ncbi:hypothetical protein L3049_16390 [Labilibaculum sp. DW002]|uniref:Lipoprotein n=1 Tax=Paralabilibaculum antarcticum TaxID=2912572 RepID=A0ABT5VVY5_9BACT|nr:hypothetical protein [Labilibaculum sp. DW002]MDE5419574.1 hypothetical protein [Labilibaculum sp. DW002]
MEKRLYILAFLTLIILEGCNFHSKNRVDESWEAVRQSEKIEDLISFAFEYPKADIIDSCILKLDQLVRLSPEISLSKYPILDSLNGEVKFGFIDTNNDCGDYYLKKQNTYLITIKDNGAFHNNKKLSYEGLKKSIEELLNKWHPKDEVPQRKLADVKYFGTILSSKLIIVLDTDVEQFDKDSNINWKQYIETLAMVRLTYQEIWNAKAQEVWKTDFSSLEFDRKLAIMKCLPFSMELNFVKRTFRN